ncbi:nuclear transport factor 2 family protein (plasmid) [Sphingobium sp. SJ10-10]|uniref:nuclear transport factor 2 family protein n=1 Tax=Sphingobium sp. SJ10-10 TaxID=3114999 RepID=UPI002E17F38A|nr:nuclear transport factor 2 family protein [Sphingobium sp. SJ10-10]
MARSQPDGDRLTMARTAHLSVEERLFRIEARQEIEDLVARYGHGADRKNDPAIMQPLFHADAIWSAEGFATFHGSDAIAEGLARIAAEAVLWSIHYMVAPYVEFAEDGRSARCRWYLWELSTMAGDSGPEDRWLGGWYDSVARYEEEEWKFASVKLDLRIQGVATPPWMVKKAFDQ